MHKSFQSVAGRTVDIAVLLRGDPLAPRTAHPSRALSQALLAWSSRTILFAEAFLRPRASAWCLRECSMIEEGRKERGEGAAT